MVRHSKLLLLLLLLGMMALLVFHRGILIHRAERSAKTNAQRSERGQTEVGERGRSGRPAGEMNGRIEVASVGVANVG